MYCTQVSISPQHNTSDILKLLCSEMFLFNVFVVVVVVVMVVQWKASAPIVSVLKQLAPTIKCNDRYGGAGSQRYF